MIEISEETIDAILNDLSYAVEEYNTTFGVGMLSTAIKKLKQLNIKD